MRPRCLTLLPLVLLALPGVAAARDGFLRDGGGIQSRRIVGTPYGPAVYDVPAIGEGRRFLGDGGGIRFAPELPRFDAAPGRTRGGGSYRTSGSVTDIPDRGRRNGPSRSISVVVVNGAAPSAPVEARRASAYGGPKIIRVSAARLDRRPFDASGIDVVHSGGAKIIRLAPGWSPTGDAEPVDTGADLENGAMLTPDDATRPAGVQNGTDAPSQIATPSRNATPSVAPSDGEGTARQTGDPTRTAAAAAPATGDLEPWTEAWRSACVERYASFDPSLGTFLDESGRRRFCTGEP